MFIYAGYDRIAADNYICILYKGHIDMKKTDKSKTKDYTLKAISKYNAKFDRIAVNLPKGSKDWIRKTTGKSCNQFFVDLFMEYKEMH